MYTCTHVKHYIQETIKIWHSRMDTDKVKVTGQETNSIVLVLNQAVSFACSFIAAVL